MRPAESIRIWGAALLAATVLATAGCARSTGPPPIRPGAACAGCGMEVHDLSFACERASGGRWRAYDAIECLIRDTAADPNGAAGSESVWLADYDRQELHRADSMWVVRGGFPSPMGGGFAAFLARPAADSVAALTGGRVERLAAWLAAPAAEAR